MGQQVSALPQKIIPADTVDSLQFEIKKQAQIFSEIGTLSYEDFQKCLTDLNSLSRKCLDPNGKQLVFAVKKGTDRSVLWKGTVRIACVKVDPTSKQVECYKLLNLRQFLQVFRTFQTDLHAMVTVETQRIRSPTSSPTHSSSSTTGSFERNDSSPQTPNPFVLPQHPTASILLEQVNAIASNGSTVSSNEDLEGGGGAMGGGAPLECSECCICMERKPEVSLPCAHSYCAPCIEQWNIHQKKCPICDEELTSTDDTWVLSEMPEADEISEEICATLMKLSVDDVKK
ncbi:RING finger protein 141-like [Toxorhynchites rutilus septentrionalis]|uniref:RING finger protein 141-like n=1 Tax=Toxorhynchites rutilus septentrionalis TaxID=329112 RepID=UPI00247A557A|nr:RING finger protein 141-like [Toxorhynchites rutilus septentrionalis]